MSDKSDKIDKVKVAEGFEVGMSEVGPYLSDGSGNAYFVRIDKDASLREKALGKLLVQLHKENKAKQ